MSVNVAEATYDYKKLFYMACGYISALGNWTDKNPMEVVDFFLSNYVDLECQD